MGSKHAEKEFASLCSKYNIWAHKWRDVQYCPHCRKPIFMTKHVHEDDGRPPEEQESIVDYLAFFGAIPVWVECKGKTKTTSWPFADMGVRQRNFLKSWVDRNVEATVYLSFGPGRAPNGRGAWWIPYPDFSVICNKILKERLSISYQMAVDELSYYALVWDNGEWKFPETHALNLRYPGLLELPPLYEAPE